MSKNILTDALKKALLAVEWEIEKDDGSKAIVSNVEGIAISLLDRAYSGDTNAIKLLIEMLDVDAKRSIDEGAEIDADDFSDDIEG